MSDNHDLIVAKLVLGGFAKDTAVRLAEQLEAAGPGSLVPPVDPAAAALAAANEAAPEADPDAARFLTMTAAQIAALDEGEYRRLFAAAKASGFKR